LQSAEKKIGRRKKHADGDKQTVEKKHSVRLCLPELPRFTATTLNPTQPQLLLSQHVKIPAAQIALHFPGRATIAEPYYSVRT
jgi:hypothetical protein